MSLPSASAKPAKTAATAHPFDTWLSRRLRDLYASVLDEELPPEMTRTLPPSTLDN